jgi:hypothetical protein
MIVFLDTGPLGILTNPNRTHPATRAMLIWEESLLRAGHRLLVPAIADYELRREHLRRNATNSLARLDSFINAVEGRYLELTDTALKQAAVFWAQARMLGLPTGDVLEMDCDVVIAAQAADLGLPNAEYVIATTNVRHLSRFVPAQLWTDVAP